MSSLEAFGPNLRRLRMRSGVSLEELSLRTKVSVELWDAMERNDFSRWPTGVAARAYIRSYAESVGADPNATIDEFCRVVPQGDRRAERIVRGTAEIVGHQLVWSDDLPPSVPKGDRRAPAPQRESGSAPWWIEANPRGLAAGIDLAVVVVLAGALTAAVRISFWPMLAVIALLYNGLSLALLGCSPAVWAIDTYVSTHLAHRKTSRGPVFTRLPLVRPDDASPDRDTAA